MRKMLIAVFTALMAAAMTVPAVAKPDAAAGAQPGSETIVEIAAGSEDFEVLVAAVTRAGLAGALSGNDQLTVFAPTDAAFEETFEADEEALKDLINSGALDGSLADILLYHVTEGRRISTSVLAAPEYEMLNGDTLTQEELLTAGLGQGPLNISASNGVIHVLTEGVLLP